MSTIENIARPEGLLLHLQPINHYSTSLSTETVFFSIEPGTVSAGTSADAETTSSDKDKLSPFGIGFVATELTGIGTTELGVVSTTSTSTEACGIGIAGEIELTTVGCFGLFKFAIPTGVVKVEFARTGVSWP